MQSSTDSDYSELAQRLPGSTQKFSLLHLYPHHQGGEDRLLQEEYDATNQLLDRYTKRYEGQKWKLTKPGSDRAGEELLKRHLKTVGNTQRRREKENRTFGKQLGDGLSGEDLQRLMSMRDNGEVAGTATERKIVTDAGLEDELSLKSGEVQSTCRARMIFFTPATSDFVATSMAAHAFATLEKSTAEHDTEMIIHEMRGRKLHDLFSMILGGPFSDWKTASDYTVICDLWPAWEDPTGAAESMDLESVEPFLAARQLLASSLKHTEKLSVQAEEQLREDLARLIESAKSKDNYSKDPVHYVWAAAVKERDATHANTSRPSLPSSG